MTDSAYPDALPARYRLHWYVLERVLGQGGFGITYLMHDTNLDRLVAIKEYLPSEIAQRGAGATVRPRSEALAERYAEGLKRFIAEARTLVRFDHPNIVRVYSVFEANGTAYMVMRFEEGEDLAHRLTRCDRLAEDELRRILLPILDGLERVHAAGFIHRDIKPENIHLRDDGSPVLLDFGSARQALGHSRTVTILVAPGYAPLEQYYNDAGVQGPWTDIYGLAATCYRAIAGHAPVDAIVRAKGVLGSTQEVLEPAAVVGRGRYADSLLTAIDHGLELAEKDRPQTLAAWRAELVGEAPVNVRPAGTNRPRTTSAIKRVRRARILWATGGAAVAAVAITLFIGLQSLNTTAPKLADKSHQIATEREAIAAERRRWETLQHEERQQEQQLQQAAQPAAAPPEEPPPPARPLPPTKATVSPPRQALAKALPSRKDPAKSEAVQAEPPKSEPTKSEPARIEATAKPTPDDSLGNAERAMARGDYGAALALVKPLAYGGQPRAQELLGRLYEEGRGVRQSHNEAYMWYSLAAQHGSSVAQLMRERVAARLQPAEIRQADRLVEAWRPLPGNDAEVR
ncbi:serine/threonine-protein kinase [Pseudogulbenkiania sp. MAI-1]|uniref:serine/threonine-protein kinase n=1 Tax=Pseudogulbenkiania sp. MAI-1 TaxID=990370 RepID=UPI00045EB951|nr:serine/threonine-protein kinase [Pseudogulbenkiania sp. MAI-1]